MTLADVDTNPFIFRGKVKGAIVRLADPPLVNVSSGEGETGFFVLEGRINQWQPASAPSLARSGRKE